MKELLNKTKEMIIDTLLPRKCVNCGQEGKYVCDSCSLFLLETPSLRSIGGLEELISVWEYEGIIKKLLGDIKSNKTYDIINELMERAFQIREAAIPEGAYITFVPMWGKKEKEMGFNPAELIARKLGEKTGNKVISLLDKTRDTSFQKDSNKEERVRIIKGSFIVKEADFIPEKVLLVDDLWESGVTMTECCRKLEESGVKLVWGFTLARIS